MAVTVAAMSKTSDEDQAANEVQIMLAAQRDLAQFAAIYARYFPRIYGYCLRRIQTAQEAEDLTSQIFTRAMVNIEQYRGGFVSAWLFRIAHNVVYTYCLSQHGDVSFEDLPSDLESKATNPAEHVMEVEQTALLDQLLARLPADQQELLRFRIVEGLTSEKIAARLGKTSVSVRVSLHRLFRRLYEDYLKLEGGPHRGR